MLKVTGVGNVKTRAETLELTPDLIIVVYREWVIYLMSKKLAYWASKVVVGN